MYFNPQPIDWALLGSYSPINPGTEVVNQYEGRIIEVEGTHSVYVEQKVRCTKSPSSGTGCRSTEPHEIYLSTSTDKQTETHTQEVSFGNQAKWSPLM